MVLAWEAPEQDGGCPITAYKVEKRDAKKTTFVKAEDVDGKTFSLKVTKLVEGNKYFFQVAAVNEVGESDWETMAEAVEAKSAFGIMTIFV